MIAASRPNRRPAGEPPAIGSFLASLAEPGRDGSRARSCSTPRRPSSRRRAGARTSSCRRAGTSKRWGSRSGCSRPGPTGSRTPGCSTCSGCRARGWSWPAWHGRGACRVVLSPICWYRAAGHRRAGVRPGADGLRPGEVGAQDGRCRAGRAGGATLLELADAILPNSHAEARQLVRFSAPTRERIHVVPNGVVAPVRRGVAGAVPRRAAARTTSCSTSAGSSRGRTCSG